MSVELADDVGAVPYEWPGVAVGASRHPGENELSRIQGGDVCVAFPQTWSGIDFEGASRRLAGRTEAAAIETSSIIGVAGSPRVPRQQECTVGKRRQAR